MASVMIAAATAGPARAEATLELVTLNAWHGLRPKAGLRMPGEPAEHREARLGGQLDALVELDPDVVFLQELNPVPSLARRYARALGHDQVHKIDSCGIRIGGCGIPTNVRSGLAILARESLGLRRLGATRLSGPGMCSDAAGFQTAESRYALFAQVSLDDARLLLVDVHLHNVSCRPGQSDPLLARLVREGELDPKDAGRISARIVRSARRQEDEARALAEAIDRRAAKGEYAGIVVAGDFNAEPGSTTLGALARRGFVPALEATTAVAPSFDPQVNFENGRLIASGNPPYPTFDIPALAELFESERERPRRIDHVLLRGRLAVREISRALDRPRDGIFPSDHFAIRVRIAVIPP